MKSFQIKCKNSFQRFCDNTSLHGFTEIYYAKFTFWKITWLIIVLGSIGVTLYQIRQAIDQYQNQSTFTNIEIVKTQNVLYPPLKICTAHWIEWISWTKALKMGFSKEAILFGMSYLTNVYSNQTFHIQKAEEVFSVAFQRNNFSRMSDFYKAIAIDVELVFTIDPKFYSFTYIPVFTPAVFDRIELIVSDFNNILLCYVAVGENIRILFEKLKSGKNNGSEQMETRNVLQLTCDYESFNVFDEIQLTYEEYNSYMADWLLKNSKYSVQEESEKCNWENGCGKVVRNYSHVKPPKVIFIDGYSEIGMNIGYEIDSYFFYIKASAYKWKNTDENICNEHERFITSNNTCSRACFAQSVSVTKYRLVDMECSHIEYNSVLLLQEDTPEKLCRKQTFFIDGFEDFSDTTVALNYNLGTTTEYNSSAYEETQERLKVEVEKLTQQCVRNCLPGCEKWSYEINVATKSIYSNVRDVAKKYNADIRIEYPADRQILITSEVDSQSWENFVGNVGGLLGIWTGASILSFIQMVYLCCCSEGTTSLFTWLDDCLPKKQNVTTIVQKDNVM